MGQRGKFDHIKSGKTQSIINRFKLVLYIREWHGRAFQSVQKYFDISKPWPWNWGQGHVYINRDISAIWWDINTRFDDLESLKQMTHCDDMSIWPWPQRQGQILIENVKILIFAFVLRFLRFLYRALSSRVENGVVILKGYCMVITWRKNLVMEFFFDFRIFT